MTTAEHWQRVFRLMDEAFENYLAGMAELRKRVVNEVKGKLMAGKRTDQALMSYGDAALDRAELLSIDAEQPAIDAARAS